MCREYANSVHCDHITQYILNATTKEWLKHLLVTFFGKFKKYWVFADGAHCGHMIQYFLNIPATYWAVELQIHCSVYSERTQYVLAQENVGILDMELPCTVHILAQYRGFCPLWCSKTSCLILTGIASWLNICRTPGVSATWWAWVNPALVSLSS